MDHKGMLIVWDFKETLRVSKDGTVWELELDNKNGAGVVEYQRLTPEEARQWMEARGFSEERIKKDMAVKETA